uniref:(Fe-S)-binding protein n=1 Tax=candidate division WOR-3 bacterium TaxID=2052148 RepID=A0A7C3YP16_UNCW3
MNNQSLLNCIQCGRCTGGCPVSLKSRLNVRKLLYSFHLTSSLPLQAEETGIWECTTCTTCNLRCPKNCEPLNIILETRANLVEKGKISTSIIRALESTFLHGNPFGKARERRTDWLKKGSLSTPVRIIKEGEEAEYLLFVCCIVAYDPRMQEIARSLSCLLSTLNVDFAILGEEENCCGSEIKRMGETGLFAELKEKNQQILEKIKIKGIITISPHCYNTLKNEYELNLPVYHYTEFLLEKGVQNLIAPSEEMGIFHDPCFLGKMNKIYEPPRAILRKALKELREFERARENSLCCEGGGGRIWIESESKERLAEKRVTEALDLKISKIFVACPFCLSTLEDAVKVKGVEETVKVFDIAEYLTQHLKGGD